MLNANTMEDEVFLLRTYVVNFRTTVGDIKALPAIVVWVGCKIEAEMQTAALG